MKKIISLILACLILFSFAGCDTEKKKNPGNGASEDVDVDLTKLSATMVYAEVSNMMTDPDAYLGKTVRMSGSFAVYHDDASGKNYFACLIADATACCSQGIEFVRKDAAGYPDDYPEPGAPITVTGVFDTYYEGEYLYCTLTDAVME